MIQSSSRKGWVLPKGGWEKDEKTAAAAAAREAWEEAGIIVRVERDLGTILDHRQASAQTPTAPKACYQFFEAIVTEARAEWPEKAKRERKWFTFAEAIQQLAQRPELTEALRRSTCKR
jgi:diphosphoinositol-polyphosphate diphosphatase